MPSELVHSSICCWIQERKAATHCQYSTWKQESGRSSRWPALVMKTCPDKRMARAWSCIRDSCTCSQVSVWSWLWRHAWTRQVIFSARQVECEARKVVFGFCRRCYKYSWRTHIRVAPSGAQNRNLEKNEHRRFSTRWKVQAGNGALQRQVSQRQNQVLTADAPAVQTCYRYVFRTQAFLWTFCAVKCSQFLLSADTCWFWEAEGNSFQSHWMLSMHTTWVPISGRHGNVKKTCSVGFRFRERRLLASSWTTICMCLEEDITWSSKESGFWTVVGNWTWTHCPGSECTCRCPWTWVFRHHAFPLQGTFISSAELWTTIRGAKSCFVFDFLYPCWRKFAGIFWLAR